MSDRERAELSAKIEKALNDIALAPTLMEDERDWPKVEAIARMAADLKAACFEWQMYMHKAACKETAG